MQIDLLELVRRIAEMERRINNVIRPARVTQIDPEKGLVKVAYALDDEDQDVESPWIRWGEVRAGNINTWNPPTVGEQLMLISPSGEVGAHSIAGQSFYSEKFPPPHNKKNESKTEVKILQGDQDQPANDKVFSERVMTASSITHDSQDKNAGKVGKRVMTASNIKDNVNGSFQEMQASYQTTNIRGEKNVTAGKVTHVKG